MAELSTAQRAALPSSAFALPATRRFPIDDLGHARNALARAAGDPEEAHVKAAVFKKYPALAHVAKVQITVPLWKDDAEHIVYGVVLTPGVTDSQGDVIHAGEIRKAAHRFLTDVRKHDVQHSETAAGVETVESFIAPQDLEIGGQKVLKDSWVLGTHISDPAVWERVTKDGHEAPLTGYSIGGSGVREPVAG